jgi:hypothetical protein
MFENTATVASAVARGLALGGMEVTRTEVHDAPPLDSIDADLLVVGAPTHAFSLSRPQTREEAVRQGAPPDRATSGVREWLEAATGHRSRPLAAVFDTRVRKVRRLPAAAAPRTRHLLEHLGFTLVARPNGFVVEDVRGPLAEDETPRAVSWGLSLAREVSDRRSATPAAPST